MRKAKVNRVCLEATGQYHLDLALALEDAGPPLMVVNPKTDAVDAAVLAEFARRMPFEPWQRPDDLALAIRACARRIAALNQLRTRTKNQLHALAQTATTPDFLIADLHHSIAHLEAQIEHLRQRVFDLIASEEERQQIFELLVSVTGIAAASAISLLGERLVLPEDMTAKQWVAMAGLDPRQYQSGSSVNKSLDSPRPATATCASPSTGPRSAPHNMIPRSGPTTTI